MDSSRRDFLRVAAATGGVFCLEILSPAFARVRGALREEVTAWLLVETDNSIVVRVARPEIGQGSQTGTAMLVAEELDCDWSRVRTEFVSFTENLRRGGLWGPLNTGNSDSIRASQAYLRMAGATAREMLITAATQRWGVKRDTCQVSAGVIRHVPSGRTLTFGQVASDAAKLPVPKDVKLKDPKDWKLIGSPRQRLDLEDKVRGRPVFGVDVEVDGLLHASIAICPVFGGKLGAIANRDAVARRRGVRKIVELPNAVAVVADNWWRADEALRALRVTWDSGENRAVSSDSIATYLKAGLEEPHMPVARSNGQINKALTGAKKVLQADYYTPLLNHATMEPQVCTARISGSRVDLWPSTQDIEGAAKAAADTAGVSIDDVTLHRVQVGGGFGRRGYHDVVEYAVGIAKEIPRTAVKLMWSRAQDMQHCFFRPPSMVRMKAGLDAEGRWNACSVRVSAPSIYATRFPERFEKSRLDSYACSSFVDSPYAIPHMFVDYAMRDLAVPIGYWRSVYHSQNPFVRECFVDEVASAARKDPYRFRRDLLTAVGWRGLGPVDIAKSAWRAWVGRDHLQRHLGVLDAAAKAARWGEAKVAGLQQGIALADGNGSYVAAVVELSVTSSRQIDIKRVILALDSGYVVNPDSAKAQIEGGVIFALTAALFGENLVSNGRIAETNFHDYRMMLLAQAPPIESVLVPSGGFWGGVGEPPVMPIAPALVNAIAAATGVRIRDMPLKNHGFSLKQSAY